MRKCDYLQRKRVPKAVFDYVDGGANDELAYARSQAIYSRVEFKARVLRDVSKIDLSTNIAGQKVHCLLFLLQLDIPE